MNREEGSILVEALVAAALVALILTAAFRVMADSAMRQRGIEDRRTALMVARSQLTAVGAALPATPGRIGGVDGDYVWSLKVEDCPEDGESAAGALRCATVSVRRTDGERPLVTLASRRLVAGG
ncbi:hypothetical protein [Caulobacter sp.]|uniref:hypothetical protein n=1 Tax=Caulobacter sp. TaxID=78 RepID=UPI003BAEC853